MVLLLLGVMVKTTTLISKCTAYLEQQQPEELGKYCYSHIAGKKLRHKITYVMQVLFQKILVR